MVKYKNLGGDSGVIAYEIGVDNIIVFFKGGSVYLYNNFATGSMNIQEMKRLAVLGQGLNSFIGRRVKKNFAMKLK